MGIEDPHGVGTAADAGNDRIGLAAGHFRHLDEALLADDRLEIPHQHRVGVGTGDGADDVKVSAMLVTQSRIASLRASLSVLEPDSTGTTVAPRSFMR